jgi:reactive chlorine resistance protein C
MTNAYEKALGAFAKTDRVGLTLMRLAIAIVFMWIGALKFVPYEADSITPFVANSPVLSFFYEHPKEYKQHLTHEGELVPAQREWQTRNNTYGLSEGLGVMEWLIALLVLSYPFSRHLGLLGAFLTFCTTLITLSFLITTPEAWVAALGDAQHGFPYLSGAGRLVLKDTMMLAGAWIVGVDAAKGILADRKAKSLVAPNGSRATVFQNP